MNLASLLKEQAIQRPSTTAIIEGTNTKVSFSQLWQRITRGATFFQEYGLKKGDTVIVFCPMSSELYVVLGVLWQLGAITIFIDPSSPPEQFQNCQNLCKPKAIVAPSVAFSLLFKTPALRGIPLKISINWPLPNIKTWWASRCWPPTDNLVDCAPDHPALVTFTSGSTGQPKTAVRTHGFLEKQYKILAKYLQPQPQQIQLSTLPIFTLINLAAGRTSLIPQGIPSRSGAIASRAVVRQIKRHRPQSILASPKFLEQLIYYCIPRKICLNSVTEILSGGAPIMPRLLNNLKYLVPSAKVDILYGSTEAEPISINSNAAHFDKTHSSMGLCVGKSIPEIQVKIIPFQTKGQNLTTQWFKALCLAPQHIGEIIVAGDHVLEEYWPGTNHQSTKIRVGNTVWHRTGDAGYLDDGDRLWLVGRCNACQDIKNPQLYPFVLEQNLQQHPQVHRAAAISHKGQPMVLVEPMSIKNPPSRHELYPLVTTEAELHFIKKIPVDRRHHSKILHKALRKQLQTK